MPRCSAHVRRPLRSVALAVTAALALIGCRDTPPPAWARVTTTPAVDASFRGLVTTADGMWASGTGATVLQRTANGWDIAQVDPDPALDIRDIHVTDAGAVIAMAAGPGPGSRVFRRDRDGPWSTVLRNEDEDGFYDGLAFADDDHGVLFGDPVGGVFTVKLSDDGGRTWTDAPRMPEALPGEHGFAASGTCVAVHGPRNIWIATGGPAARVLHSPDRGHTWNPSTTPLAHGQDGAGVFSLAFVDARRGIAVGGNYTAPDDPVGTAAWTDDGGRTWHAAARPPGGYRSGVAHVTHGRDTVAVAVGTSGADLSRDGGRTWDPIPGTPALNAVAVDPTQALVWAAGPDGAITRLDLTR